MSDSDAAPQAQRVASSTEPIPAQGPGRRSRRWSFRLIIAVLITTVTVVLAEGALRLIGRGPWVLEDVRIKFEPSGPLFQPHDTLGWVSRPGRTVVTLGDDFFFTMNHDERGRRWTRSDGVWPAAGPRPRATVWVLGCSFTQGFSVEDEASFPWQLQTLLPDLQIENLGASGYGTLQCLLQLRALLAEGTARPDLVVLTYASFHDRRNTMERTYYKASTTCVDPDDYGYHVFPCARFDEDGELQIFDRPGVYIARPWITRSAVLATADAAIDAFDRYRAQSQRVSQILVEQVAELCRSEAIELVVAVLTPESAARAMLEFCQAEKIAAVDVAFDYDDPRNLAGPGDPSHPSRRGHAHFAAKLAAYLSARLDEGSPAVDSP